MVRDRSKFQKILDIRSVIFHYTILKYFALYYCYHQCLAYSNNIKYLRSKKDLDTELNKVWGAWSCLLSQEATASYHMGLQHFSTKGSNSLPPSSGTWLLGGIGGGAWPKSAVSLSRERKSIWSPWKLGKFIGHFEKASGLFRAQANTISGEQRCALSLSFSLSFPDLHGIFTYLLHGHVAQQAAWPMVVQIPHRGSKWEPECRRTAMDFSWKHMLN